MHSDGESEEKDGCGVQWRKMERRRRGGAEWGGEGKSINVIDCGKAWVEVEGFRKEKTERFVLDLQHNHPMCLCLAWQRHN